MPDYLLRIPLFYKILLANVFIVALGAAIGTGVTVWYVDTYPGRVYVPLIAVFVLCGLVVSFVVNNWVLKRALAPLDRLQAAVDEVRSGAAERACRAGRGNRRPL